MGWGPPASPFLGLKLLLSPVCPAHLAPAWGPALPVGEGLARFRKTTILLAEGRAWERVRGAASVPPPLPGPVFALPLVKLSQD